MKKYVFLFFWVLGCSIYDVQASVTYAQLQTAITHRNGDQFALLATAALGQTNKLCVFEGLVYSSIISNVDLTTPLRFSECSFFSNNPSGCYNNFSFFCDNTTCCTNTNSDPITARAIDVMLALSVLYQVYEVTKFLLLACPYATVNIDNLADHWTLLMWAAQFDDLALAKLLIRYGADITACSNTGLSVIGLAEAVPSQDMINLLIYTDQMNVPKSVNA